MTARPAHAHRVGIDALADYPDRIDVRSPAEYAQDHLPHASNQPVLDDRERARVGTLYVSSVFAARKLGAAMVARNIAAMLETTFADQPREWTPLVYCWRGGQRSRSLAHILNEVGWRAMQLDGGYRAYRRHVVDATGDRTAATAPDRHQRPHRLRQKPPARRLGRRGGADARSRAPGRGIADRCSAVCRTTISPARKAFRKRLLLETIAGFDPARPVFVESESRRIGALQLPDALLARMREARRVTLAMPIALRVRLLLEDYRHFLGDASLLRDRLSPLTPLHGKAVLAHWDDLAKANSWETLVEELLGLHYDPTYRRSLKHSFGRQRAEEEIQARDISPEAFSALAREVIERVQAEHVEGATAPV